MKALSIILASYFVSPFSVTKSPPKNIIVISMDGVIESDAKRELSPLIGVFENRKLKTNWYGEAQNCTTTNPANLSLPAYSVVFSGKDTKEVSDNFYYKELHWETIFSLYDFHLFSSWKNIKMVMKNTNKAHIVWGSPFFFEDELVLNAYFKVSPNLSFIHFSDADEFAHIGKWSLYSKSINNQKNYILSIIEKSPSLTSFIIFTDHGRADNNKSLHGRNLKGSERIWVLTAIPEDSELKECSHIGINKLIRSIIEKN